MTTVPFRTRDDHVGPDSAGDSEAPRDAEAPQLPLPRTSAPTSQPTPGIAGPHRLPELDGLHRPQLAIRSDAVVLVSMRDLARHDLTGRKRWIGIELTPQEVAEIRRRFMRAEDEAIAHVGEKLGKKKNSDS